MSSSVSHGNGEDVDKIAYLCRGMERIELTNRLRKLVSSLDGAKERREEGLFVAEGTKCVLDTLHHFKCRYLFASKDWQAAHASEIRGFEVIDATRADFERMSHLSTPPKVLAVYEIPEYRLQRSEFEENLTLILDKVQDPGNLGTIVRVADWFGIRQIVCSPDTVDIFNPKVVQSTMGAISRVKVVYADLPELLAEETATACCGTFLDGDDIYASTLPLTGFIVMGNEGQGISPEVERHVSQRLRIPSYPAGVPTSESLNVGMATAITVAEFRRRAVAGKTV